MDAVYSGQAGVMALLEGAEARIHRADDFDLELKTTRENVSYLFLGCTDVVLVRGAQESTLRPRFEEAWRSDRALRLFIISLDPEEDRGLREEAADCLEDLLRNSSIQVFIENEFYSRGLPEDTDCDFLLNTERWKLASELLKGVLRNQSSIKAHRVEWERLPVNLFEDVDKDTFEEHAIRQGAFRILASTNPNSEDRNLAILDCYKVLANVPNSRAVITKWTADFRRPGSKHEIFAEEPEQFVEEPEQVEIEPQIGRYAAFERAKSQQIAIIEKLRRGSLVLAKKYANQLVEFQLKNGGPEYAAKSLCSLAQEAKYLHLHSIQLEWALRAKDINPSDPWAHGHAADALIQYSRLDEALQELALVEKLGDAQFAATSRARILRNQGKFDEALVAFRSAQEMFEGQEGVQHSWWGAAETLREMWKFEEALQEYELALAKFPNETFFKCGKAAVLADLGRPDEALTIYNAPDLDSDLVALNGKASVLKDQGKLDEAQRVISEAIEIYPADPIARCIQAEILRLKNDYEGALQLYDYIRKDYESIPMAYGGYPEVLRDMKRLPEAIAEYKYAINKFPDDARLANGYANIYKVNDELAEALRIYEENVRRFPYDLIAKSGRADLLKRLGKYDDAINAYDNILSTWPNYETAKNGKAAVLVIKGQYEQAMSLLSAEMPSARSDWIGRHILGMIYLRRNQLAEAIRIFEEGVEKVPFPREKRYFMNALSVARLRENKFEQAVTSLSDTAEGLSNVIRMHAYAGMGKTARARTLYDELRNCCPIQIADLRDAIAGRYGLATDVYAANDNWIFERETEALLQEAA